MAVIMISFLSAALSGAYLFHCAHKKKRLGAVGAGILALIGLGVAVALCLFLKR